MGFMTDALERLFGSANRIRIIRLFYLNPKKVFVNKEISRRAKVQNSSLRREISLLEKIGFIKKAADSVDSKTRAGRRRKVKVKGWALNSVFPLFAPLKNLVLNVAPISRVEILKRLKNAGNVKLIVLSGIFIQDDESRVDLLIVGDSLKQGALEREIANIEALVGKELSYSVLSTQECLYRLRMYDKFIRDILDYPHEKILNKLDIA
ncbi:MAG: putative transcriptional regulator [Parcubacteria group bacterium GW2011_GWC2_42_13]|nr:MAG: putative transcriptional regulator [Parcubacteria group bacterium GW2011_GWC2_42_13]